MHGGRCRRVAHAPGPAGHIPELRSPTRSLSLYLRGGTAPHACSRKSRKVEKRKNLGFSNGFEAGLSSILVEKQRLLKSPYKPKNALC